MWSLTVRIVLSLCLILNGFGTSHAGMPHAAGRDSLAAGQVSAAETGSSAPCHGAGAHSTNVAAPHVDVRGIPETRPVGSDNSLPDCCRHSGCRGSCLQQPPAAIASWFTSVVVTHTFEAPAVSRAHAPPESPPLTRPPIA